MSRRIVQMSQIETNILPAWKAWKTKVKRNRIIELSGDRYQGSSAEREFIRTRGTRRKKKNSEAATTLRKRGEAKFCFRLIAATS